VAAVHCSTCSTHYCSTARTGCGKIDKRNVYTQVLTITAVA
jgi:hypothetical protein